MKMSEFNRSEYYENTESLQSYILRVLTKMGLGLAVTAAIAYACYYSLISYGIMYTFMIDMYPVSTIGMLVAQLGVCMYLSVRLTKMESTTANVLFFIYAVLTGITFSTLPIYFGMLTVFQAFLYAAVMFGSCVVIGHTTNVDMSRFGGLLLGALVSLIVCSVLQLLIPALRTDSFTLIISYAGIFIFLLLTAFDMQRIKEFYRVSAADAQLGENLAVYGAFQLYLDFINIFLKVLRILGSRRRN